MHVKKVRCVMHRYHLRTMDVFMMYPRYVLISFKNKMHRDFKTMLLDSEKTVFSLCIRDPLRTPSVLIQLEKLFFPAFSIKHKFFFVVVSYPLHGRTGKVKHASFHFLIGEKKKKNPDKPLKADATLITLM